jgi:hypothetical protein
VACSSSRNAAAAPASPRAVVVAVAALVAAWHETREPRDASARLPKLSQSPATATAWRSAVAASGRPTRVARVARSQRSRCRGGAEQVTCSSPKVRMSVRRRYGSRVGPPFPREGERALARSLLASTASGDQCNRPRASAGVIGMPRLQQRRRATAPPGCSSGTFAQLLPAEGVAGSHDCSRGIAVAPVVVSG